MEEAQDALRGRRWIRCALVAIILAGVLLTAWTWRWGDRRLRETCLLRARLVAAALDIEQIKSLSASKADLTSPSYLRLKKQLSQVLEADGTCRFVYLMGRHSDGVFFFYVDSEPPGSEDESLPGDVYDEATEADHRVFETCQAETVGPATDHWGTWVSPCVPIMDPHSNALVAVLCMDIDASRWHRKLAAYCMVPVAFVLVLLMGWVAAFIGYRRVQEREQARRAIEEHEAKMESIVQGTPIPTFVIDKDRHIIHWNKALEELSGIPAERMLGTREPWRAFYAAERLCLADLLVDGSVEQIANLYGSRVSPSPLAEGAFDVIDFFPEVRGGAWLHCASAHIRDRSGRVIGAIETIEDITERMQMEEELRESEKRFRSVLENLSMIAIQAYEPDGTITFWNRTSEEQYGYSAEEALGLNIAALLFTPEDMQEELAVMAESLRTGTLPPAGESEVVSKDGIRKTVYASRVFHHRAGKPPEVFCFDVDITERKRAEEELRASEARLRVMSDSLPSGMIFQCVIDAQGKRWFTYVSAGVERTHGITAQQALNDPMLLYGQVHEEDRARLTEEENRAWASMSPLSIEVRFVTPLGERWSMLRSTPRRLPDGCTLWDGIELDITEQRRAEAELEQAQALLRAAIDQSPAGILIADTPSMRIRMANAAAFAIHGDPRSPVDAIPEGVLPAQGRLFWPDGTVIPPEDLPLTRAALKGETVSNVELVVRHPDGNVRWLLTNGAPIRNARNEVQAGLVVFTDITDIKQAEEARRMDDARREAMLTLYGMAGNSEKAIADYTLEALGRITKSPLGYIAFVNDSEDVLTIYAWSSAAMAECRIDEKPIVYPVETTGLWGEAVRQRKPIITNDFEASNPLKRGLPEGHVRLTRHLNVPIFDAGKIVVLAGVGNKIAPYTEEDIRPIELLLSFMWSMIKQRRAEESLRESEQRFRGMAENLIDVLFNMDEEGVFTYVSPSAKAVFGWRADEIIGRHFAEFLPDDQMLLGYNEFQAIAGEGKAARDFGFFLTRKDGSVFPVELNASPVRLPGGGNGIQGLIRDSTERRRAEALLREKTEELERYFATALDLFCIGDIDGHLRRLNRQWERTLGYKLQDLEGRCFVDFVHPDDLETTVQAHRSLQVEEDVVTLTNRFRCKDGSYRWIEWRSYLSGKTVFSAARDVTDRKKAEDDRKRLEAQLLQAQKMEAVGRLAGGVAHDFNNMLFVILAHADIALSTVEPSDPLYQVFSEIQKAAQRSSELTRQLLAFARKQIIVPKVLDLNGAVEGVLKMLRRLIGEDIELLWKPGLNLWAVKMDPAQVDQILANLTVNARDAITGVGKMTIETHNVAIDETYCEGHADCTMGNYAVLSVSDNGCGMDYETRDRLFEPFFTTKGAGKGTGLGLATVYGIVRQNGGFINVYSEVGTGTTFRIYLPRYAKADEAAGELLRPKVLPTGNETVLLVEDELSLLGILQKWMEQLGYVVLAADSPVRAIELAQTHKGTIDLLMTDVIMPGMNGRDLAKRILETRPGLKLLFMSGYTANVIAHHGVLDEGIHFLQKPCDQETLATRLREAIG